MKRKSRMTLTLTLALLGASPILAAPQQAAPETEAEDATSPDLKAAQAAKLSVLDAVGIAEKHANGGKVLEVSFKMQGGRPTYFLRTYQNGAVWEGSIDANSGAGLGPGETTPESDLDDEDKAELAGLRAASTILSQAVSTAEEHAKGKAVSGGLDETESGVVWEVIVAANGAAWTVIIDPRTGRVVSSNAKT
jgi:uncharacterized membrane protein YkoI